MNKLKPTLGETYSALELEIKFMDEHIANETDDVTKNELRELRRTLGQCLIQTRIIIDRKMRLSKMKHDPIN